MSCVKVSTGTAETAVISVSAASSEGMLTLYANTTLPARRRLSLPRRRDATLQVTSTSSSAWPTKVAVVCLKVDNKTSSLQATSASSTSIVTAPSTK